MNTLGFVYRVLYIMCWYGTWTHWFDTALCLFYRVPLHYASAHTHGDCVASLINAGRAAVNITDRRGCTPLHYASAWDHDAKWDSKIYLYCVLITNITWLKVLCLEFRMFQFFHSLIDYLNRLSQDLGVLMKSYLYHLCSCITDCNKNAIIVN